jgi:trans-aconitate methyltransferase
MLEGLDLRGDETALDLGCGTGTLTEHLLRRLPHGRVIAADRTANMLQVPASTSKRALASAKSPAGDRRTGWTTGGSTCAAAGLPLQRGGVEL